jgi:hypothetical protein
MAFLSWTNCWTEFVCQVGGKLIIICCSKHTTFSAPTLNFPSSNMSIVLWNVDCQPFYRSQGLIMMWDHGSPSLQLLHHHASPLFDKLHRLPYMICKRKLSDCLPSYFACNVTGSSQEQEVSHTTRSHPWCQSPNSKQSCIKVWVHARQPAALSHLRHSGNS